MEKQAGYVTRLELIESQQELKNDMNGKIEEVDDKVDHLNKLVLPLLESSKQTAKNTERMAQSLDEFTSEQRTTNGKMYSKMNDHDKSITELNIKTNVQSDVKNANAKIIVAVITAVGALIVGIFNLAPLLFN